MRTLKERALRGAIYHLLAMISCLLLLPRPAFRRRRPHMIKNVFPLLMHLGSRYSWIFFGRRNGSKGRFTRVLAKILLLCLSFWHFPCHASRSRLPSLSPLPPLHTHSLLAGVWRDGEPLGDPAMPAKTPRGVSGVCAFARIGGEEAKRREREGREELHIMQ